MNFKFSLGVTLLCTASSLAICAAARAQNSAASESVVVTGSRIEDATLSPTPLTVLSTDDLQATTPSSLADALNKIPQFVGSQTRSSVNNASADDAANVLNLRNFGVQRTLVLLDGQRIVASNSNGTVNVDTLPQILVNRVDVVTAGASAVYGSDAVSGVVNYILNTKFEGLKVDANSGISSFGDAATQKVSVAAGSSLFGGKGHWEASFDYFSADPVYDFQRPEAGNNGDWILTGTGTAQFPYTNTPDGGLSTFSFGGKITCTGCAANGQQFIGNDVIGPFNPGTTTGTTNITSGGDAAHNLYSNVAASSRLMEGFGRLSYDIDDTTTFYVNLRASTDVNRANFVESYIQTGNVPNVFYSNNPYLPAATQALLADPSNTFQMSKYNMNLGYQNSTFKSFGTDRVLSIAAGLDGKLWDKYDWHLYYSHEEDRQKEDDPHNINNQLLTAAEDVRLNSSNNPVCYVSTTPSASLYPGCVPLNLFGPSTLTLQGWDYYTQDTYYTMTNTLDDLSGVVSGTVFDLPAGPVKVALSGESRWLGLNIESNGTPGLVNCTGLSAICNSTVSLWQGNTVTPLPEKTENVWEFATEIAVPILKDVPLVQNLSTDAAGRFTNYSTTGAVETWKIGLDWHINDDLRLRGTNSIDIRAPTLNDLYAPVTLSHSGFTDLLTGASETIPTGSQGNPNLVPEVARTYTVGVVLTPDSIPGFTASLDYYSIRMKNAISTVSGGTNSVQDICIQSGGTSPYCALYVRPYPYTDTTRDNNATQFNSEELNTALQETEGYDFEANYGFDLSDVIASAGGAVHLRLLANYQPLNATIQYPGSPYTLAPFPHGHISTFLSYHLDTWTFTLQDRWISGWNRKTLLTDIYVNPEVPAYNYEDLNIDKMFTIDDRDLDVYLTVQNLGNLKPPVAPNNNSTPDLYYMGLQGTVATQYDFIGRYFTLGARMTF